MATVKFIPAVKNQTAKGLNGTLRYCCRPDKTEYGDSFLVSGVNCVAGCAYQEFLNTKRLYNKTDGRMFYHLIQSFHPDENLTPQTAHEIALKLAEQFDGFEVVVATHTDRDHIHSHLIINSVSIETGKKYHSDKDNIQHLRDVSDDLCRAYGLSVIKPKPKKTSTMSSREYRAADKGQSWKLRLAIAIDDAMELASSREHFISLMEAEDYQVRWTADRKYITYTTLGGDRCRDNKLHEEKYRKGGLTMNIPYIRSGDYFIPNLKLPEEIRPIGKWGRMHREYLKEHHPIQYTNLVLSCELWTYLADLNEQAQERLDRIMQQMKEAEGVTETLKATDPMAWVQRMNSIRNRAEEIILHEMIYGEESA